MSNNSDILIKLYTHPACACGDVIDLVNKLVKENGNPRLKEISLVTKEGRQDAFAAGVKTIPSVLFIKTNVLLVTSSEITEERVLAEIEKL